MKTQQSQQTGQVTHQRLYKRLPEPFYATQEIHSTGSARHHWLFYRVKRICSLRINRVDDQTTNYSSQPLLYRGLVHPVSLKLFQQKLTNEFFKHYGRLSIVDLITLYEKRLIRTKGYTNHFPTN